MVSLVDVYVLHPVTKSYSYSKVYVRNRILSLVSFRPKSQR